MNQEELLRTLARSAKRESPPVVDVSGPVLRHIRALRLQVDPPMAVMAALSAAAAVILLVYSTGLWSAWQDPMTAMLLSTTPVLQ
jgi:hypothetical protein